MSSPAVLFLGNASKTAGCYTQNMAAPRHDWYLKAWLKALGRTQQWLADQLDVQKSMISRKANGVTGYDRDDINMISAALNLRPFELLLPPEEANELKQLQSRINDAIRLVAEQHTPYRAETAADQPARLTGGKPRKRAAR